MGDGDKKTPSIFLWIWQPNLAEAADIARERADGDIPPLYIRHKEGGPTFVAWPVDHLPPSLPSGARTKISETLIEFDRQGEEVEARILASEEQLRRTKFFADRVLGPMTLIAGVIGLAVFVFQTFGVQLNATLERWLSDPNSGIALALIVVTGSVPIVWQIGRSVRAVLTPKKPAGDQP